MKQFLIGSRFNSSYLQTAEQLEMSEGAVKVAVHRLRRRYRKLLKEEIAKTVVDSESFEDEMHELMKALGAVVYR
jgi:RNA polymerase sigma-70 factor (ECF subfamily)